MRTTLHIVTISLLLVFLDGAYAGSPQSPRERIIICIVSLEHADAEQMVAVLSPFLSPQGKIVAYAPANTLIIKDHPSVVRRLVNAIKGKPDLSECQGNESISEGKEED